MEQRHTKFVKEEITHTGNFLKFVNKHYDIFEGGNSNQIVWECIGRVNNKDYRKVNAAEIIAVTKDPNGNKNLLIIENFRYANNKFILEFPCGIIEDIDYEQVKKDYDKALNCDDPLLRESLLKVYEQGLVKICILTAERELKEETGYIGKFKSFLTLPNVSPLKIFENTYYDPWKSSENAVTCLFEVDKDLEENKNPKQNFDECEIIKVHEVPVEKLLEFISHKLENEGCGCATHLYNLAMGMKFKDMLKDI